MSASLHGVRAQSLTRLDRPPKRAGCSAHAAVLPLPISSFSSWQPCNVASGRVLRSCYGQPGACPLTRV